MDIYYGKIVPKKEGNYGGEDENIFVIKLDLDSAFKNGCAFVLFNNSNGQISSLRKGDLVEFDLLSNSNANSPRFALNLRLIKPEAPKLNFNYLFKDCKIQEGSNE
jgi:hypothetical protein